jgi:hypothetical protein
MTHQQLVRSRKLNPIFSAPLFLLIVVQVRHFCSRQSSFCRVCFSLKISIDLFFDASQIQIKGPPSE